MQKQKRRIPHVLTFVISAVAIVIVVVTGVLVYTSRAHANKCEPTAAMERSSNYDMPCSVGFTVKELPTRERMNELLQAVHGKMDTDLASIKTFYITVPAGTEQQALDYLSSQPEIESVFHNHCCAQPN